MAVRPRFVETTRVPGGPGGDGPRREPVLVVAHHPMLSRIGETLAVARGLTEISRLQPSFAGADGRDTGPLDDPFVSRKAVRVHRGPDGAIDVENPGIELEVAGVPVPAGRTHRVVAGDVARGVPIALAGRVLLWLTADHEARGADELGMLGASAAMHGLRAELRAAASARGPILVRGETGTGKELVARALHRTGPRADGPYVGVNVAAIPAAVAAAELFGHERGAFTGATERRAGYFERARGGVLFLDEIGDLSDELQPVLLRALEAGEIQPIGGEPRAVDVVVVAATDAELPAAVRAGRFRSALFHRLASTVIDVPVLRARGADVALLLARFLRDALPDELADRSTDPSPWLTPAVIAALVGAPWPGNVRQLKNVAQRLAAIARAGRAATLEAVGLDAFDGDAPGGDEGVEIAAPARGATAIDEDRLVAALREHGFQLSRTAAALGISRSHLDALIARSRRLRKANQLGRDEIAACAAELGDDLDAIAARLEVSPRGLRLRMRQLGM